jgi:hypothetical protein
MLWRSCFFSILAIFPLNTPPRQSRKGGDWNCKNYKGMEKVRGII